MPNQNSKKTIAIKQDLDMKVGGQTHACNCAVKCSANGPPPDNSPATKNVVLDSMIEQFVTTMGEYVSNLIALRMVPSTVHPRQRDEITKQAVKNCDGWKKTATTLLKDILKVK